jgi:ribonucleoside-diphosphate reductase alpha chain
MEKPAERQPLGEIRKGLTRRQFACGFKFYLTVNFFEGGDPAEVFIVIAKEGSTVSGFTDALAITISIALQHGVPWSTLYHQYLHQIFEPRDDKNSSLVDAIGNGITELTQEWKLMKH